MADASALDYGAQGLLAALLMGAMGLARQLLRSVLRLQQRQQDTLESMDQHLDLLTVEVRLIRRELERGSENTPSEVPHPSPRAQSIPFRKRIPTRNDE